MLVASKIQAVGALRMYRLNTSTHTTSMRIITSHAIALPTQVLMWSARSRKRCVFIGAVGLPKLPSTKNEHHPACPDGALGWSADQAFLGAAGAALAPK